MADNTEKISSFCTITGASAEQSKFFLEAASWDLDSAIETFYSEHSQDDSEPPLINPTEETGVPDQAKRFASMAEYQGQKPKQDEGQSFFAGGSEHSGQLISGPPDSSKKPQSLAKKVFEEAKKHGARSVEDEEKEEKLARNRAFIGQGYKLGQNESPSKVIGAKESHPTRPEVHKVIRLWENGFSIDDGPLRDGSTEEDKEFLDSVSKGEIPLELRTSAKNGEISVDLEDHRNEPYQKIKPKMVAFSGEGHRLGSVAPPVYQSQGPAASSGNKGSSGPKAVEIPVDSSQPITQIQIRLADGSRLVGKFNHTHTVGDIKRFIHQSSPEGPLEYRIMTTFPNRELVDDSLTIEEAQLINAVVVQRRK